MTTKRHLFSTPQGSESNSIEEWQQFLEKAYYKHHVETEDGRPLYGVIEKMDVGDAVIVRTVTTSHTISRDERLISADGIERHAIVVAQSGLFLCEQRSRSASFSNDGLFILNSSEPFSVNISDDSRSLAITLPADLCRLAARGIDDKCCVDRAGEPALIEALIGLLTGIFRSKNDLNGQWLQNICCDLLEAMLNPRYSSETRRSWVTSDAARSLLIEAARLIMRQRLHKADFTILEAASACGVSVRHLQSAYQSAGSSFAHELMNARLQRAAELLRNPARARMQLGQIADACGFKSHSHFSRRYKDRFGLSPRDETFV